MNTLASFTATDTLWMLVCACFVFFMQAGFTCYEAGLVQSKNVISVAIENIFNLTISIVLFSLVGFPMMFGETIFSADSSAETAFVFLQIMFAAVSVTIFAGALSERTKLAPLLVAGAVSAALIYPLFGRLAWGSHLSGNASWLEKLGFLDFAGASVVHMTAGFIALAGLLAVGSRSRQHTGKSNIPLAVLGVFILWFGWFGFNGGGALGANSLAATAFINTDLGASAAMVTWLIISWIREKSPSFVGVLTGAVAGLATITPGAGFVKPWAAIIIGVLAGIICYAAVQFRKKLDWDDALDVWGVHGVGGIIGTILLGIFASKDVNGISGLIEGDVHQFGIQIFGTLLASAYAFVITMLILKVVNKFLPVRVTPEEERIGLDASLHHEEAYHL